MIGVTRPSDSLPTDLAAAHAIILAQREALVTAENEAKSHALLIEKLLYTIAKLHHERFGQSAERGAILEQLELSLSEPREDASAAAAAAQLVATRAKVEVKSFARKMPAHRPLPGHL